MTIAKYTLAYKCDRYTTETLTYNSRDKNLSYVFQCIGNNSRYCFNSRSYSTSSISYTLKFANETQQMEFEDSLKSKNVKKVLDKAKIIESVKDQTVNQLSLSQYTMSLFLCRYIAAQEKTQKYNNGFFVRHGIVKSKTNSERFEEICVETPRIQHY